MWYSEHFSAIEYEKLIQDGELLLRSRFALVDAIKGASLHWLVNAIKYAMKVLLKGHPHYKPIADAMFRYLQGSGKDVEISEDLIPKTMKGRLLKTIREKGFPNADISQWQPNEKATALFTYDDYTQGNKVGTIKGNEIMNPLMYVIGSFTEHAWYEIDENGTIHVFCEFEDIYDWDVNQAMTFNLADMGLTDPKFSQILTSVCSRIPGINYSESYETLFIEDKFWHDLEKYGLAKSYKHHYKNEILTLSPNEIPGANTPGEMLTALSSLTVFTAPNLATLEYAVQNGYEENIKNVYPNIRRDAFYEFTSISERANKGVNTFEDIDKLIDLLDLKDFKKLFDFRQIYRDDDVFLTQYFDERGRISIPEIIIFLRMKPIKKAGEYLLLKHKDQIINTSNLYELIRLEELLEQFPAIVQEIQARKEQLMDKSMEKYLGTEPKETNDVVD